MPITVPMLNDATGRETPVVVPDAVLQEIASLVLAQRAWRDLMQTGSLRDLESMRWKWKGWLSAMRVAERAQRTPAAPMRPPDTDWIAAARQRRADGASWRQLSKEFGRATTTIRRELAA